MASIQGQDALQYSQLIPAVANDVAFKVNTSNSGPAKRGAKIFTELSNGDVIAYKAISMDDPSKWEIGRMTYVSSTGLMTRVDATVLASSNSDNTVDFKRADGTAGSLLLEGLGTHAILPIINLTSAFGTGNNALVDCTGTHSQTILNDNFKDCVDKIEEIILALEAANIIPAV